MNERKRGEILDAIFWWGMLVERPHDGLLAAMMSRGFPFGAAGRHRD
jgi:hypothetical protein